MKESVFRYCFFLLLVAAFFVNCNLYAQRNVAVGVRIGGTTGVSVKYFFKPDVALEGILGTFGNGTSLTGLLEKHQPVYDTPGLFVYYGGGAHLAFYNGRSRYYSNFGHEVDYYKNNNVGLGINGIVGLEYRFPANIPISVTFDLKPFIEFGSGGYVSGAIDPSVGLRFTIR